MENKWESEGQDNSEAQEHQTGHSKRGTPVHCVQGDERFHSAVLGRQRNWSESSIE